MKHTPSNDPSHESKAPAGQGAASSKNLKLVTALVSTLAGGVVFPACAPIDPQHIAEACDAAERNAPLRMDIKSYKMEAEGLYDNVRGIVVTLNVDISGLSPELEAQCQGNPRIVIKANVVRGDLAGHPTETYESLNGTGAEIVINGRQPPIVAHVPPPAAFARGFVIEITDQTGTIVLQRYTRQPDAAQL